jgi:hypothetical protein
MTFADMYARLCAAQRELDAAVAALPPGVDSWRWDERYSRAWDRYVDAKIDLEDLLPKGTVVKRLGDGQIGVLLQ